MTVLIVDDEEMHLNLVRSQLLRAGYGVIACQAGEEAIEMPNSQQVDLILTDMEMPVMTGEDVLNHVRKEFGSLPVILMSGNPENLRREGFDGYLEKPFSMRELLQMVETLGKRPQLPSRIASKNE